LWYNNFDSLWVSIWQLLNRPPSISNKWTAGIVTVSYLMTCLVDIQCTRMEIQVWLETRHKMETWSLCRLYWTTPHIRGMIKDVPYWESRAQETQVFDKEQSHESKEASSRHDLLFTEWLCVGLIFRGNISMWGKVIWYMVRGPSSGWRDQFSRIRCRIIFPHCFRNSLIQILW
jgi:hypothetical protein